MRTRCVPGDSSRTAIGVRPASRPSTNTAAPAGVERTSNLPTFFSVFGGTAAAAFPDDRGAVASFDRDGAGCGGAGGATAPSVNSRPVGAVGGGAGDERCAVDDVGDEAACVPVAD